MFYFNGTGRRILNPNIELLKDKKQKLIESLDNEILNCFSINEQEKALVDYAMNITIPLIMKHKGYEEKLFSSIKFKDPILTNYAKVFFNRFQNAFDKNNKKFTLEIVHNDYIIGMFFRVTDTPNIKEKILWKRQTNKGLMSKLLSIGRREITESLFIQKDIRGFERNGFYIIKPNEKKLWHEAIAYLDEEEFADAILRTGGKESQNG